LVPMSMISTISSWFVRLFRDQHADVVGADEARLDRQHVDVGARGDPDAQVAALMSSEFWTAGMNGERPM